MFPMFFIQYFQNILFFRECKVLKKAMSKQQLRIKPFVVYTKIQQAYPAHSSNLINKELGYDTLVQRGDEMSNVKIKNCICSARANSELFKRFSRSFITNMKNQIDQLIIFTSVNPQSRLETSVGLQTNPGIFLIIGLTFLDEKYKQPYHKCEVQFSFLEFREGQMYDLLCYTEKPLQPQRESSTQKFINFKEHWVKTTTFNQFIKYFKIALFNNKDRDFKTDSKDNKCRSTFIMKVRSKIFNFENQPIKEHTTILMDYEPNCQKENLLNAKEKSIKNIMQYFLIEINNSNPANKPIHYHLVEQNHLLLLLKKFLPKVPEGKDDKRQKEPVTESQIMFIHSFPAQKEAFDQAHAFLQNILNHLNDEWEIKVQQKEKKSIKFNHQFVKSHLKNISNGVSFNTYTSLRNFNAFKHYLSSEIKKNKTVIKEFKKIITQFLKEKLELQFLKNQMIAYQFKLIGGCIKSDHFKDFYNAKSYLQLGREIKMKTQAVKEEILEKWQNIEQVQKKFEALQKKEAEGLAKNKDHITSEFVTNQALNFNSTSSQSLNHTKHASWAGTATKFKKIGVFKGEQSQKEQMRNLSQYFYQYISNVWDIVCLTDQRTVFMSINLQQEINKEEEQLNALMNQFSEDISCINETDIMYQQENNQYSNNQIALFRSLNFLGMLGPKKKVGDLEIGKRIMMKENQTFSIQKPRIRQKQMKKLPTITTKNIVITGDLKISDMLRNPNEQVRKSFVKSVVIQPSHNV